MQPLHESSVGLQKKYLLGPKPRSSAYLNELKLETTQQSIDFTFEHLAIDCNEKKKVAQSVNKNLTVKNSAHSSSRIAINKPTTRKRQESVSLKKTTNTLDLNKGKLLTLSGKEKLNKIPAGSVRTGSRLSNRRSELSKGCNTKLTRQTEPSKLFNSRRSLKNDSEKSKYEDTGTIDTASSRKPNVSKVKNSTYLNKLSIQNKINSNKVQEKAKMVVIDLENADRIDWKEKYAKNNLKSKLIEQSSIPFLHKNKKSSNDDSYVMYFYLN